MANTYGTRPVVLDTVMTDPQNGRKWIKSIQWDSYDVDSDVVSLEDSNGNVVWAAKGKTDLSPVWLEDLEWVNGYKLTVLSSGVVRIYFK